MSGSATPPGWYPDRGGWRWWDGTQWGEWRPASGTSRPAGVAGPNTGVALLAHLGGLIGGFLVPLIIYLVTDPDDRFVREHSAEALNFQLTLIIAWIVGFVATVVIGIVTIGLGLLVMIPALIALAVVSIVFMVQGAIAANRAEAYRYPVNIRFVQP